MNTIDKDNSARDAVTAADVLGMLPRDLQFRFLDEIVEIDASHIIGRYRFRDDEFFYPGHFPEKAVTPGTILLEAMCQCGMAAQSYYLLAQEMPLAMAREFRILFTGAQVEWFEPVGPGATITIRGQLIAWRRRRIRAHVKVFDEQDRLAAESHVAGMSVLLNAGSDTPSGPKLDTESFEQASYSHGGVEK